jgi:hypothetical protein
MNVKAENKKRMEMELLDFLEEIFKELFHFCKFRFDFLILDLLPGGDVDELELFSGVRFRDVALEYLLRTFDRVFFIPQEMFDVQDHFDVFVCVDAVAGAVLGGGQEFKLSFPVAEDVLFQTSDLAYLTDRIVEFLYPGVLHRRSGF